MWNDYKHPISSLAKCIILSPLLTEECSESELSTGTCSQSGRGGVRELRANACAQLRQHAFLCTTKCAASSAFTIYKDSAEGDITVSANAFHGSLTHGTRISNTYLCAHTYLYKNAPKLVPIVPPTRMCTRTVEHSNVLKCVASG